MPVLQTLTTEPRVSIVGATAPLCFRHVVVERDPDLLRCKLRCYSVENLDGD
jgi:hypothetical protein